MLVHTWYLYVLYLWNENSSEYEKRRHQQECPDHQQRYDEHWVLSCQVQGHHKHNEREGEDVRGQSYLTGLAETLQLNLPRLTGKDQSNDALSGFEHDK